jgi:phage major head subunit gpT-like protein
MNINSANLDALRVGFQTIFDKEMALASTMWTQVATETMSAAASERYGWLGEVPELRQWVGPRAVNSIKEFDYSIQNVSYEQTIGVQREKIEDDTIGVYASRFKMMGRQTGQKYDKLVFDCLKNGFTTNCYDGQFFFDVDHPQLDANGVTVNAVNTDGGAGQPWFLLDSLAPMLPIILQKRKMWEFAALDKITDPNVFMNKEFYYGVDGRCAAGYGFWHSVWGSKQALTSANYAIARAAIATRVGDYNVKLGLEGNLLVCHPSLESDARKLLNSDYGTGGITNEWKNTAKLLVCNWL